jgi:NAD(P)-dependent dehydrogenase (short-subunit alcohol dehydrogenase family)
MMNIDLTGQTAVVTGASRGIGLAVTSARTASGARVIAGALRSSAELDKLAAEGTVTTLEPASTAAWSRPGKPGGARGTAHSFGMTVDPFPERVGVSRLAVTLAGDTAV